MNQVPPSDHASATESSPKSPKPTTTPDDSPKFGRLLIVLFLAVALIVFITFATEAYYSN
jgi:hypothetical protein